MDTSTSKYAPIRPPLFDGSNYTYWKKRMTMFIKAHSKNLWNIVLQDYKEPQKSFDKWTKIEIANDNLNSKL